MAFATNADPIVQTTAVVSTIWKLIPNLPAGFQGLMAGIDYTEVTNRTYKDFVRHGVPIFDESDLTQVTLTWKNGNPNGPDPVESGVSTGGNTATTLNDTTKNWTPGQWQNFSCIIKNGTGKGQSRAILTNTPTQLVLAGVYLGCTWTVVPDATSEYVIKEDRSGFVISEINLPQYVFIGVEATEWWVQLGKPVLVPTGLLPYLRTSSLIAVS